MKRAEYDIASEAAMERFGRALAAVLPVKIVVGLMGTLGAGKTRLVRAMAESWEVPLAEIGSPTFVLCREYQGTRTAYHLDTYRLTDENELLELGFEELLGAEATVLLEWADRVRGCLPKDFLQLEIEVVSEEARRVILTEYGGACGVIDQLNWPKAE